MFKFLPYWFIQETALSVLVPVDLQQSFSQTLVLEVSGPVRCDLLSTSLIGMMVSRATLTSQAILDHSKECVEKAQSGKEYSLP
jgi:hypothetical protein